jgi:hypothetical protein
MAGRARPGLRNGARATSHTLVVISADDRRGNNRHLRHSVHFHVVTGRDGAD